MPWTDSNAHDPGITVLEVLAYSIVGYAATAVLSDRVRGVPCGWRCVGLLALGAAGAVALRHAHRADRTRGTDGSESCGVAPGRDRSAAL